MVAKNSYKFGRFEQNPVKFTYWIVVIRPWQINFKLDVLHPIIINFNQGSATWARDGGGGVLKHPVRVTMKA